MNQILGEEIFEYTRSMKYLLRRLEICGKIYISIVKTKKWSQDGQFHPQKNRIVCVPEEIFVDMMAGFAKL